MDAHEALLVLFGRLDSDSMQTVWPGNKLHCTACKDKLCFVGARALNALWDTSAESSARMCSNCKHVTSTSHTLTSPIIQLEIPSSRGNISLMDCFNEYFAVEAIVSPNQPICDVCNARQDHQRGLALSTPPKCMVVTLKRYKVNPVTLVKSKISKNVHIPQMIDLRKYIMDPAAGARYKLSAVVLHHGTSTNSGHYTAIVSTEQGYVQADDITVKQLLQLPDKVHSNGYIMFYERQDSGTETDYNGIVST